MTSAGSSTYQNMPLGELLIIRGLSALIRRVGLKQAGCGVIWAIGRYQSRSASIWIIRAGMRLGVLLGAGVSLMPDALKILLVAFEPLGECSNALRLIYLVSEVCQSG